MKLTIKKRRNGLLFRTFQRYLKFKNIIKELETDVAFFSLNKLKYIVREYKDTLPRSSQKNVVYRLSCKDCNATYVGRKLKTRINEHKKHIRRKTNTESVITEHRLSCNHDFDWENFNFRQRKFFGETLNFGDVIKRQNNSLNLQSDIEYLHHAYVAILDKI